MTAPGKNSVACRNKSGASQCFASYKFGNRARMPALNADTFEAVELAERWEQRRELAGPEQICFVARATFEATLRDGKRFVD